MCNAFLESVIAEVAFLVVLRDCMLAEFLVRSKDLLHERHVLDSALVKAHLFYLFLKT